MRSGAFDSQNSRMRPVINLQWSRVQQMERTGPLVEWERWDPSHLLPPRGGPWRISARTRTSASGSGVSVHKDTTREETD